MPVIIMCGLPSSGKSRIASALSEHLGKSRTVFLISDEHIGSGLNRDLVYTDSAQEKDLRGALKSEVMRQISKETVVICDAANYIKGYRYELYCLSKSVKTTHCVIHCDLLPEDCWLYNEMKPEDRKYSKETFSALVQRFEVPDSRHRWDSPLFILHKDEKIPFTEIDDALFLRKAPPPNLSTQTQPLAAPNFLYEVDKITQDITKRILNEQKIYMVGDSITIPDAEDKIYLSRSPISAAELSKIRRQFLSFLKTRPIMEVHRVPNMFVQYINRSL